MESQGNITLFFLGIKMLPFSFLIRFGTGCVVLGSCDPEVEGPLFSPSSKRRFLPTSLGTARSAGGSFIDGCPSIVWGGFEGESRRIDSAKLLGVTKSSGRGGTVTADCVLGFEGNEGRPTDGFVV
jgi:hypothetical protein